MITVNNEIEVSESYKPVYKDGALAYYERSDGNKINFYIERDDEEPSESVLYRVRGDGEMKHDEKLINGKWIYAPLFYSYQFDALLERVTLEEAQKVAEQIHEPFVE